ncbi:MAG: restriction endonuclease subunit S [Verrucomicrobiae bacterium]|nr:restriction endonuclease subunit S [Verrucomicrobiae bacterium]
MTTTKLEKVATVYSGFAFRSQDLGPEGIPVIKIANIQGKRVLKKCADYLPTALFKEKLQKYVLNPEDTLVAMTGAGSVGKIGKMHSLDRMYLVNQRVGIIRPLKEAVEPQFLYYTLSQNHYEEQLYALGLGAGQPNVSGKQIGSLEIPLPDLPTQRKIAGILSAYDDLIENNLRRIRILEEMAQSLYREWFVHFRFPGHESTPMVDSPLGPIPEGWGVKPVSECFEITGGGTPSKKVDDYWEGGTIQWYSPRDLTAEGTMFMERSADQITELGLKKSSARMFSANSVMLTSRATIGAIAINTVPACTNQGFITCLPNDRVPVYFLYQWLKANVETFISHASGATFKEISKGVFRTLNFLLPPPELVARYEVAVSPVSEQLLNLQRRNQTLRQTRDLLLPKLLSGQMRLDLEEAVEAETPARSSERRPASRAAAPVAVPSPTRQTVPVIAPKPAAEKPTRVAAAPTDDVPPSIYDIARSEVLCTIRKLFAEGWWRNRETALKDLSVALGYRRLGPQIREVLSTDLLTAVRRGILTSDGGEYALGFRSVSELPRDILKDRFLTAIGRNWITRDDAIRDFARSLGFARTGDTIDQTARSLINGLIREGRLESDGGNEIRRV